MILSCQYSVTQLSAIYILVSFPGSNFSCKAFASQPLLPFPCCCLIDCSVLSLMALLAEDRMQPVSVPSLLGYLPGLVIVLQTLWSIQTGDMRLFRV